MAARLRILIVEDVPNDAELSLQELKRAGIVFDARRVETASEYRRELEKFKPQLILADFTLPNFAGTEALAIARGHFPDIPFIFVSGSIGEENAIRALKQGANDYVMKTNLVRLSSAVERAMQEQRERTTRKDAESALRASELLMGAIIEAALDCIVTIDAQGRVIELNPAAAKTFGYTREEALGKELAELIIPPASREAHRQGLKHYHATGEGPILGKRIEVSAMRKDGSEFPVELTVVAIRLPDQTLFSAHIRDITERKQAELRLRESEERFRQVAENIREVFWLTDPSKNQILYVSPGYEDIWCRSCASVYASPQDWIGAIHPEDRKRVLEAARTKQASGEYVEEYRIVRPDGTIRWVLDKAFPVFDRDGNVFRIAGIAEDITERKYAEQSLQERAQIAALGADVGAALTRGESPEEMLQQCCEAIVLHLHAAFARIWTLNERDDILELRASAGLYVHLDGPHGRVPVGKFKIGLIAQERKPHLTNQVVGDPRVGDQEWAKREGMVAFAGYPLLVRDHLVGVVAMFARTPLADVTLQGLASISNNIALGIERKLAEEALRESEAKLRKLIDGLGPNIFVGLMTPDGTLVEANESALAAAGLKSEDVLGMPFEQTYWWAYSQHVQHQLRSAIREAAAGSACRYDVQVRVAADVLIWIDFSLNPLRDECGKVASLVPSASVINERKLAENALRESELRFRRVAEQSPDAIVIHQDGKIVFANDALVRLMRATSADHLVGQPAISLVHPERRQAVQQRIQQLYGGGNVPLSEQVYVRLDGTVVEVEIASSPFMLEGKPAALVTVRDITERKEQEKRIARLSRIHAVLSGINSAIVRIRDRPELFKEACRIAVEHGGFSIGWIAMLDHASGTLIPAAQAGLPMDLGAGGDSSDRPVGLMPWGTAKVALRDKRPAYDNDIERGQTEVQGEFGPDTLSIRRTAIRLGAKSVVVLPLYVEGNPFGILTLYAPERNFFDDEELKLLTELAGDISFGLEFIAKEEKVDYLAYYDALTGLPNRSLFFDRLTHQLGTAVRDDLNVALVLMDLDRFRLINDTLGRQAGDTLLNAVAQRIRETIRDQDTVARVGADRFAVAVSGKWRIGDVAHVLEARNEALFGQPFLLGQEEQRMFATAGVAMFPSDGDDPETLFANAEAALRKAKQQNARILFYGPEMNARIADSLRLENRLRRALDNGEMVLWYQPLVSVESRRPTGLEALMRWQDPETGMVPPARFIPLMEQTGLILDAGKWAMSQVARDCKLWATAGFKPPRVAVNVSPLQIRQEDFIATVVDAVRKTEEAGALLGLEITESVIMENVETIIPILQTLRKLGVEIAVDDFGTGYSSLAYIARLPIHDLKVDRSFIVGMTQTEDNLTIVKAVISLAHSLRLNVVAEGVETEEQAGLLLELGCDEMQGYLFSPSVPPDKIPVLLSRQRAAAIRPARRR